MTACPAPFDADMVAPALASMVLAHLASSRAPCFLHTIMLSRRVPEIFGAVTASIAWAQGANLPGPLDPGKPQLKAGRRLVVGCVGYRHLAFTSITQMAPWRGKSSNGPAQDHALLGRVLSSVGLLRLLLQRLHVRFQVLGRLVLPCLDGLLHEPRSLCRTGKANWLVGNRLAELFCLYHPCISLFFSSALSERCHEGLDCSSYNHTKKSTRTPLAMADLLHKVHCLLTCQNGSLCNPSEMSWLQLRRFFPSLTHYAHLAQPQQQHGSDCYFQAARWMRRVDWHWHI